MTIEISKTNMGILAGPTGAVITKINMGAIVGPTGLVVTKINMGIIVGPQISRRRRITVAN